MAFTGEKVADKSGERGPKSGKKARGSGGSTTTRMASKAAMERVKAADRENKKLREEKLVAEKRLDDQVARMDTLFSVVTMVVEKLSSVTDCMSSLEKTSGARIETAVDAMRVIVQDVVNNRGSLIEHMNQRWLLTVEALHLTATTLKGRRREDDDLLLRGVVDALELRDNVVKTVTSATQQGFGAASATGDTSRLFCTCRGPYRDWHQIPGDGKQKRKSKAKAGSSKGTAKAAPQGRKGSGVRVDKETGLAVAEMKFGRKSRYICRSMDKTEAAYCIVVAVSAFDGYVSDVILGKFGCVKEDVMKQYESDRDVARLMSGGMWMVMWSRGANLFRDRFQDVVNEYNRIFDDRAALMVALRHALWFRGLPESTKDEEAAKKKMTNAMVEAMAGEGGAAATVRGASSEFAHRCKSVIEVVLQRAPSHQAGEEEVADMVKKAMKEDALRFLPQNGDEQDHDEVIARVMTENLAFWGDSSVDGPKLKACGVVLPTNAEMKTIIRDKGPRGQHKGKQAVDA
ncbi:unnamed protein product [Closterium sp. Yama58-4]|nr:unnamed protein product [Closterium sp. Yama58-4]